MRMFNLERTASGRPPFRGDKKVITSDENKRPV